MRIKLPSISKLRKILWDLCRDVAFKIYSHKCFTCGAPLLKGTSNMQLGHFIPRSTCGALLKYDMRNLRWQCMRCNQFAGGNGAEFYRRMVTIEGQEYVDQLFKDKERRDVMLDRQFLEKKIQEHKNLL